MRNSNTYSTYHKGIYSMTRVVRLTISLSDLCSLTKWECVSQIECAIIWRSFIPKPCDVFSLAILELIHLWLVTHHNMA